MDAVDMVFVLVLYIPNKSNSAQIVVLPSWGWRLTHGPEDDK